MITVKSGHYVYYLTCDHCGKDRTELYSSLDQTIKNAQTIGWSMAGGVDTCPSCLSKKGSKHDEEQD